MIMWGFLRLKRKFEQVWYVIHTTGGEGGGGGGGSYLRDTDTMNTESTCGFL